VKTLTALAFCALFSTAVQVPGHGRAQVSPSAGTTHRALCHRIDVGALPADPARALFVMRQQPPAVASPCRASRVRGIVLPVDAARHDSPPRAGGGRERDPHPSHCAGVGTASPSSCESATSLRSVTRRCGVTGLT